MRLFLGASMLLGIFVSLLLNTHPLKADTNECSDVLYLFARGSGQTTPSDPDAGDLDDPEFYEQSIGLSYKTNLTRALPEEIQLRSESLNYPAFGDSNFKLAWADFDIGLKNGNYWTSKQRGSEMLANRITDEVVSCPHQQVVLAGYSQGAHVVGDTLDNLTQLQARNVTFGSLFGDPRFNPDSFAAKGTFEKKLFGRSGGVLERREEFADIYKNRLESWCLHDDGFCENRVSAIIDTNKSTHGKYADEGWVKSSAVRAAKQATDKFNQQNGLSLQDRRVPVSNQDIDVAFVLPNSETSDYSRKYFLQNLDTIFSHPAVKADSARFATVMADYIYHNDQSGVWRENDTQITGQLSSYVDFKTGLKQHRTLHSAGGKTTHSPLATGVDMAVNDLQWRTSADKHIIILTDRSASKTDSRTGKSYQEVIASAQDQGFVVHTIATYSNSNQADNVRGWAADLASPVEGVNSVASYYYVGESLTSLFDFADEKPVVIAPSSYTTQLGAEVNLSMAGSYSPSGEQIVSYDWDIDDDGVYNKSTLEPKYSYTNEKSENYQVRIRITSSSGKRSITRIPIFVTKDPLPAQRPPVEPSRITVDPQLDKSDDGKWYMILSWLFGDKEPLAKATIFDQLKQYIQPRVLATNEPDLPVIAFSLHDESGVMIGIYDAEQRQTKVPLEIAEQNSKLGIASHTEASSSEIVYVDVPELVIPKDETPIGNSTESGNKNYAARKEAQARPASEIAVNNNGPVKIKPSPEVDKNGEDNRAESETVQNTSSDDNKKSENFTEVMASVSVPAVAVGSIFTMIGLVAIVILLKKKLS